jgi:hypothetical protein
VSETRCSRVREVAPEVALGLLTGEERAVALAHLEGCAGCRAEVASLAGAADEVLLTAPEVAPPGGFHAHVVSRLAELRANDGAPAAVVPAEPPPGDVVPGAVSLAPGGARGTGSGAAVRRLGAGGRAGRLTGGSRRRRVVLAGVAAAAAVVVLLAALVVRDDRANVLRTAAMRTGSGEAVGEVSVLGSEPAIVSVRVPGWPELVERWGGAERGSYWLAIELEGGARTMAQLESDRATWQVPVESGDVAVVSVLDGEGRVWCTARIAA